MDEVESSSDDTHRRLFKILVVNARYSDLEIEQQILDPNPVIGVTAGTPEELLGEVRANSPDAIIVGSTPRVTASVIGAMDRCQAIVRYGVGVDNIDVETAHRKGITVANVRDYCTDEVATHALMLILACARDLPRAVRRGHDRQWGVAGLGRIKPLAELTVGIVGFGAIGRRLAGKLTALGVSVRAVDPWVPEKEFAERGVSSSSLSELLSESDIVSINSPLTDETRHLIDEDELQEMKKGSYLVNTARAEIVNESALIDALESGHLSGAALDVLRDEPPSPDSPMLENPAVLITPHMAWYSYAAVERLRRGAAEQVRSVLNGEEPRYAITTTSGGNPRERRSLK